MDPTRKEYICEVYKELLGCVEKLEVKVKNDFNEQKQLTIVCDNDNVDLNNNDDVQENFKQIIGHLKEIKANLDNIRQHDEKITKISLKKDRNYPEKAREVVKRHVSLKKEVRQPQMKYLVQWEKYLDEHKLVETTNTDNEEVEQEILPKPIIKKRIKQFEGENKRVSSTNEKILDVRMSCITQKMEDFKKIFEEDTEMVEEDEEKEQNKSESLGSLPNLFGETENSCEKPHIFEEDTEMEGEDDEKEQNKSESLGSLPNLFGEAENSCENPQIFEEDPEKHTQSKPKIVEVIYKKPVTNR